MRRGEDGRAAALHELDERVEIVGAGGRELGGKRRSEPCPDKLTHAPRDDVPCFRLGRSAGVLVPFADVRFSLHASSVSL